MAYEKILAIDDDRFFRTLYEDLLTQEGYQVTLAESGEEALETVEREDFHLVITDMMMGGMNGIETLEAIKKIKPEQTVVMVTSEKEVKIAVEALKKGAADYINKPIIEDEFRIMVRRLLDRSRLTEENAQLIEENLEQMRVLEVLSRAQDVFFRVEADHLLDYLLEFAMAETNATRGAVLLRDPSSGRFMIRAKQGLPAPFLEQGVELGEGLLGSALAKGGPWAFRKADLRGKKGGEELDPLGGASLLLPLKDEEQILGALLLSSKVDGNPFGPRDVNLLLTITSPAVFAIKKSFLFEKPETPTPIPPAPAITDRVYLQDLLDQEIKKSHRYQRRFSLILLNFEGIKRELQASGLWNQEKVMEEVSAVLRKTIRAADVVGALEGREMAIVVPETEYQGAITVARRIHQALRELFLGQELLVSPLFPLGLGIACFPEHGPNIQALLDRARSTMGRAAEGYFRYEMIWEFVDRLLLEAERSQEVHRSLTPSIGVSALGSEMDLSREIKYLESEREHSTLSRFIEDEVRDSLLGEGLLYVGVGTMSRLKDRLDKYRDIQAQGTKVFVFGADDWLDWDPGDITPVIASDPDILRHRFLLYYGIRASYGLMVRQKEEGSLAGFFTTNAFLVNELMKKLKEIYL